MGELTVLASSGRYVRFSDEPKGWAIMARVLITGVSTGIGRATAIEAVRRGHQVVATARRPETLEDIEGLTRRLRLDVTDQASVDAAVEQAEPLDALISNAGQTVRGSIEGTPLAEFERIFQVNTFGALRVVQRVLPAFRARRRGRLLFVSSIVGRFTLPLSGAYAASKWALEAIAETLALEGRQFGIRVTLLEPGSVRTGTVDAAPSYLTDTDPYHDLLSARSVLKGTGITPQAAAARMVDVLEMSDPPLRLPVGEAAARMLADQRATPDDRPFIWWPRSA
jgi:NAD(P)-dependent dehydrogenase (short-subunit alcohol dehydrogenase family)